MGATSFTNGKPIRIALGFLLGVIWILFGCQFAGRILPSIAQASPAASLTLASTAYPGPGLQPSLLPPGTQAQATQPAGGLYPYPGPGGGPYPPVQTGEAVSTTPAGGAYPYPGATFSAAPSSQAPVSTVTQTPVLARTLQGTPGPSVTLTPTQVRLRSPTATVTRSPGPTRIASPTSGNCDPSYPEICIPPPPPDLDCSDITQRDFVVLPPDPHFFDLDYDTIGCEADELAGPGEGYPYPGAFTQPPPPTQAPAEGNPYPGPGFPTPSATRLSGAAPFTPTGTLRSPWSPTPPPPAFIPTQPAPIMTEAIPQPSFPTATRVPFLSPTPTLTQTPTVTPTRRPPSPWVSSRLRATDPRTVKLASGKPQLVEFFAFWSGPSQAMAPIVHSLEQSYADQVNFTYLDIDDPANKAFKTKLGFRFEPHFFLLDAQGNILDQWVGYVQTQEFIDAFDAALRK